MYDLMQYSVEWANIVTSYLKKQLGNIILPSVPRLSLNIRNGALDGSGPGDRRRKGGERSRHSGSDAAEVVDGVYLVDAVKVVDLVDVVDAAKGEAGKVAYIVL